MGWRRGTIGPVEDDVAAHGDGKRAGACPRNATTQTGADRDCAAGRAAEGDGVAAVEGKQTRERSDAAAHNRSQSRGPSRGIHRDRKADRVIAVGQKRSGIAGGVGVADAHRTGAVAQRACAAAGGGAAYVQRAGGDAGAAE